MRLLPPATVLVVGVTVTDTEGMAVKLVELVAVPPGVVTLIGPVVTPAGAFAVMEVAFTTVKLAVLPLNLTAVAPVKLVPVRVTNVFSSALEGVKPLRVGGAMVKVAFELGVVAVVPP